MKFALLSTLLLSAVTSSALVENCSSWANEATGPLTSITQGEDGRLTFCCREADVLATAIGQPCCGGARANLDRLTYKLYTHDQTNTTNAAVPVMLCKPRSMWVASSAARTATRKPDMCEQWTPPGSRLITMVNDAGMPHSCCPAANVGRNPYTKKRECRPLGTQVLAGLLPAGNAIQEGLYAAPLDAPNSIMIVPLRMFAEKAAGTARPSAFLEAGETCEKDVDCGPDAVCKASKCFVFSGGEGEACNLGTFVSPSIFKYCGDGLSCRPGASGVAGTCAAIPMGEPCSASLTCGADATGFQGQCMAMDPGSLPVCSVENRHLRLRRRV
jgi:hypothetical protein